MKKIKFLMLVLTTGVVLSACKDQKLAPILDDGKAPQAIKNPLIENVAGGAKITYTLPDDLNLLYVKAEYQVGGTKREAKASFYQKTIVIEGFGDTLEHEVNLFAVSRGEKASAAVAVRIRPLTPAVLKVRKSLTFKEVFGGFSSGFSNIDKANVVIVALLWDAVKSEWRQIDANYTALESGIFKVRGLKPELQKFGLFVKDRWNNMSDTLKFELTPIPEFELDGTKFVDIRKKFSIPQINPLPQSGAKMIEMVDYSSSYPWKNLFDGNTTTMFHTKQNVDQPTWLPVDLGKSYRLSRYKLWQRTGSFYYSHGNPHEWEIWGTNTPNDVNSWVKLDHQMMIKSSGLPVGQNTTEDIDIANNGQEYDFPDEVPAVRYIAWKAVDCWGAIEGQTGFFHLFELKFFGQVK